MEDVQKPLLSEDLEAFRAEESKPLAMVDELPKDEKVAPKRFRTVNRMQTVMQVIYLDRLLPQEHPARGIWEMVSQLDMSAYEEKFKVQEGGRGRSGSDPRVLMAVWIYGYSEGVNSARELSRMCAWEPGLQWLTGMEGVNHHTLSDFRAMEGARLKEIFTQVLGLLSAEGLVTLKRVMQDGTKIKAQASVNSYKREDTIREHLELAKKQVEELEAADSDELSARCRMAQQRAAKQRQERLEKALKEFERLKQSGAKDSEKILRVSETDPEARIMKQADGGYASSFNVQVSTDAENTIILAVAATQAGTDYDQMVDGLERVKANTGTMPEQSVVDGGYIKNANIEKADELGVDLIGPATENNPEGSYKKRGIAPEFYPEKFQYDDARNVFTCPEGKLLTYQRADRRNVGRTEYQYRAQPADCQACPFKDRCSPRASSRIIIRREDSEPVKAYRAKVKTEEVQAIYRTRAQVAETPHLWIKEKFGLRQCRLRGLVKVEIEAVWASLTYNIQQWMRLVWKPRLAGPIPIAGGARP